MVTWEALTLETTAGTGFADKVNDVSCRCSFKGRVGKLDLILTALNQKWAGIDVLYRWMCRSQLESTS